MVRSDAADREPAKPRGLHEQAADAGNVAAMTALAQLLRGTGLTYRQSRPTVFVLVDPSARAQLEPEATQLEEVVVTGTYLRGAESPSPVTVITQEDVARQGRATVAETLAGGSIAMIARSWSIWFCTISFNAPTPS